MSLRLETTLWGGLLLASVPLFAGFASTETYLPAVGRVPGKNGAEFYTTVWATNLTGVPQTFTFEFLKTGQSNTSPASFHDSLAPGETRVYENVVETKLGLTNALGAARILSSGEIFVSERIYNQNPGDDLGNTEGLFFAGVPKTFSISAGQSASIQGIDQGGSENFRYNFALIETGGGSPTVNVQVFDGAGAMLGQKSYPLLPYEHVQPSVDDVVPGIATTNARITATVTGGSGSVLLAGAQVANESQDSSGFEMTFRDSLLGGGGGGGTAGVTSLDGLTGALTLKPGSGISITPSGSQISIAYTGGGGSGLTAVTHDPSLAGEGTGSSPLSIANGAVVRSINGLHDNLTLAAGSNVTITPNGSTLTIASTGSAGLTLPFHGTASDNGSLFTITNTNSAEGQAAAVEGQAAVGAGVIGTSGDITVQGLETGVAGASTAGNGVFGLTTATDVSNDAGVNGYANIVAGVRGTSAGFDGVHGEVSNSHAGVAGLNHGNGYGVYGTSASYYGVYGSGTTGVYGSGTTGVQGTGTSYGVYGIQNGGFGATAGVNSGNGPGLYGESNSGSGIYATSTSGYAGYFAGDVTYTGSLAKSSDARFKIDVAPLADALDDVIRLRAVTYDWRRDEFPAKHFPRGRSVGFIAQEVETVLPSLVSTGPDGFKGVDYAALTPILVEAIKAQQREIDELTSRLERIEGVRASGTAVAREKQAGGAAGSGEVRK